MNNNLFNLINQLTQESKSLWRIKNNYLKDVENEAHKDFWITLAQEKESQIAKLQEIIKSEINK